MRRLQEAVSLQFRRKHSNGLSSLDGLSCHSGAARASKLRPAPAERAHLPNGGPSSRPPGSSPAGSASGTDSDGAAPPLRSSKRRRMTRQQQEAEGGKSNGALPAPDLSAVPCAARPSAGQRDKQEKGSEQQRSARSQQEPSTAETSETDSAGEVSSALRPILHGVVST